MKKQILNLMAALAAVGLIAYTGCGGPSDDPEHSGDNQETPKEVDPTTSTNKSESGMEKPPEPKP